MTCYFLNLRSPLNRSISAFLWVIIGSFAINISGQVALPTETPAVAKHDLIHFGDVIDVDMIGGFEYDWRGTLTPEGFLDGPEGISDPIYGLCRAESAVAEDLAKSLSAILREPRFTVKIIDRSNRAVVQMIGGIKTPSRFRLMRRARLNELLIRAGGLTDNASGEIRIFRPKDLSCTSDLAAGGDNGSATFTIKVQDLLSGKAEANPVIFSGDMITIETGLPVFVIGAVVNPRSIIHRSGMTVSRAVASAGGFSREADGKKILITRRTEKGADQIEVDLEKLGVDGDVDEVLKPYDIVDVAAKRGGKRKYPPASIQRSGNASINDLPLVIVD